MGKWKNKDDDDGDERTSIGHDNISIFVTDD